MACGSHPVCVWLFCSASELRIFLIFLKCGKTNKQMQKKMWPNHMWLTEPKISPNYLTLYWVCSPLLGRRGLIQALHVHLFLEREHMSFLLSSAVLLVPSNMFYLMHLGRSSSLVSRMFHQLLVNILSINLIFMFWWPWPRKGGSKNHGYFSYSMSLMVRLDLWLLSTVGLSIFKSFSSFPASNPTWAGERRRKRNLY